jgi:formylglycine-generating enzyme required for sulfatase activity/energy-coupling factor transporter ATP-binding protein EcfA2
MHAHTPYGAWLIGAESPGLNEDLARLRRVLGTLPDGYRPHLHGVLGEPGQPATLRRIEHAFAQMQNFKGRLLVWMSGHGDREPDESPVVFFRTDDTRRLTLHRVWRWFNHLAERPDPVVVVLDCCSAAPYPGFKPHPNLVAIYAGHRDEQAGGRAGEGSWLTQRLLDALEAGQLDVNKLRACLRDEQVERSQGFHTPEIVAGARNERLRLSWGTPEPAPAGDGAALWREHVRWRHQRLIPFRGDDDGEVLEKVFVRVEVSEAKKEASPHLGPCALDALLARPPHRWIVTGAPGSGKTTLARYLAGTMAKGGGALPIYLSLAALAEGSVDPLAAAVDGYEGPAAEHDAIKAAFNAAAGRSGGLCLLLDGFDEVAPERVKNLLSRLGQWLARYEQAQVAIFSRPEAFQALTGFKRAAVEPLGADAQEALLTNWLGDRGQARILMAHCHQHHLSDLLQNPLMVTLLAMLHREGKVALARGQVFDEAVDLLLGRGHCEEHRGMKSPRAARRILAPLSLALHQTGGEAWLVAEIDAALDRALQNPELKQKLKDTWGTAEAFLADLGRNAGLLAPQSHERGARWQYLHRSLRELLAAEALLENPAAAADARSALSTGSGEDRAAAAGRWGNVLVLACGRAPQPWPELAALREADAALALRALVDVAESDPQQSFDFLVETDGWDGDHLLALARRWPAGDAQRLVAGMVTPQAAVDDLAAAWYALESIGRAPERAAFFQRTRHPLVVPALPWVDIPAGEFLMGSPEDVGHDDERPQRQVRISAFRMLETPVTCAQYRAFDPRHRQHLFGNNPGTEPTHPANKVSWWAAFLFARWCGALLPTEAQWEYACRAGSTTRWSHGDDENELKDYAWYDENSGDQTHAVRLKRPNRFQLFDMHGNVWEWCHDWYADRYPSLDVIESDTPGPPAGVGRVWRGGSCWDDAGGCQSAYRGKVRPSYRGQYLGFRLALPTR